MKSTALVSQPRFGSAAGASLFALALLIISHIGVVHAQNEPILVPDAVDYQKLLPILPDPPQGWVADKAEGSGRCRGIQNHKRTSRLSQGRG